MFHFLEIILPTQHLYNWTILKLLRIKARYIDNLTSIPMIVLFFFFSFLTKQASIVLNLITAPVCCPAIWQIKAICLENVSHESM